MKSDIIDKKTSKCKIIIVTNQSSVIDSLKFYFHSYDIVGITNSEDLLDAFSNNNFDLLILDYDINPKYTEYVIPQIRKINQDIYILLLLNHKDFSSPIEAIHKLDVQSFYEKNDNFDQLLLLVESALKSVEQTLLIKKMNIDLQNSSSLIEKSYLESIEILRNTVEARDFYTKGHSERVSEYSLLIGEKLNLSSEEMHTLKIGALFHDIGKIGIPDSILLKKKKLTHNEFERIKDHPSIGAHILSNASIFSDIIPIVKYHHERYDGNGYPYNLSGDDIPFLARIVAVADSFDAMTTQRSYRNALKFDTVVKEISTCSGTQFDPDISKVFLDILENDSEKVWEIYNKR